jgi:hypothetical protein
MLNKASCGEVNYSEIYHLSRGDAFQGCAQQNERQAPQQQQIQAIAPRAIHLEPSVYLLAGAF